MTRHVKTGFMRVSNRVNGAIAGAADAAVDYEAHREIGLGAAVIVGIRQRRLVGAALDGALAEFRAGFRTPKGIAWADHIIERIRHDPDDRPDGALVAARSGI